MRLRPLTVMLLCSCIPDLTLPPRPAGEDRTPPDFTILDARPLIARTGTVITMRFIVSEDLPPGVRGGSPNPEITLGGASMTCTNDQGTWTCTRAVDSQVSGPIARFRLIGRDGNSNEAVEDPVEPAVRIDDDPPAITGMTVVPGTVTAGTGLTVTLQGDELLSAATLTGLDDAGFNLFGGLPMCAPIDGGVQCTASTILTAVAGTAVLTGVVTDEAGNPSPPRTATVEVVRPMPGGLLLSGFDAGPNPIAPGRTLGFVFDADRNLQACALQIANSGFSVAGTPAGMRCTGTLQVPANQPDGVMILQYSGSGDPSGFDERSATVDLDAVPPSVSAGAVQLLRRPIGVEDQVAGAVGAANDDSDAGHLYPGRRAVAVRLFASADGGAPLLASQLALDGQGGFAAADLPGTRDAGHRTVWMSAIDLAGNESTPVVLTNSDITGPAADGTRLVFLRRPMGSLDLLWADAGGFSDTQSAVAEAELFDRADAGGYLATAAVDRAGGMPGAAVGSGSFAPGRVWVRPIDKCGNRGPLVEALDGRDVAGPGGNAGAMTIVRRGAGQADGVTGSTGALVDSVSAVALAEGSVISPMVNLGTSPVDATGAFAELTVGDGGRTYGSVQVRGIDKCGNVGAWVDVLNGQDTTPPSVDAGAIVIVRRPLGQVDGVFAMPGSISDPLCGTSRVDVFRTITGQMIGSAPIDATGGFAEVAVGDPDASYPQIWIRAFDRCGTGTPYREVLNGGDSVDPVVSAGMLQLTRFDFTRPDEVSAAPGAFTDVTSAVSDVRLYDSMTGGNLLAVGRPAATGALGATTFGTALQSYPRVYFEATDKCGNVATRVIGPNVDATAPTCEGTRISLADNPHPAADVFFADAGAAADPNGVRFQLYTDLNRNEPFGPLMIAAANGGLPATQIGSLPATPFLGVACIDKPGNRATASGVRVVHRFTTAGRTGYDDTSPSRLGGWCFGADVAPELAHGLYGVGVSSELDALGYTERATEDAVTAVCSAAEAAAGAVTYVPLFPAALPPPRVAAALAWDERRRRLVLFGGQDDAGALGDLWTYEPATNVWSPVSPGAPPPARRGAALSYDPITSHLVLTGGIANNGLGYQEAWVWDGGTWQSALFSPSDDFIYQAGFPVLRHDRGFVGGVGAAPSLTGALSTYGVSGGTRERWSWSQVSLSAPPRLVAPGATHDPISGRVVFFGGRDGGVLDETWAYDYSSWTRLTPPGGPSAREHAAMAYSAGSQQAIVYGGRLATGAPANDVWALGRDGGWALLPVPGAPPLWGHAMAAAPSLDRVFIFGGSTAGVPTQTFGQLTFARASTTRIAAELYVGRAARGWDTWRIRYSGWGQGSGGSGVQVYVLSASGVWTLVGSHAMGSPGVITGNGTFPALRDAVFVLVRATSGSSAGTPSRVNTDYVEVEVSD